MMSQEFCVIFHLTALLFIASRDIALASYRPNSHVPACDGKQVIVQLFEWRWRDVARECEEVLSPRGFCGVQVSSPIEHAVITKDFPRPWWERYQPVSYKLVSRSGPENHFREMVSRCNAVGVRIFVDLVVNHMAAKGRMGPGIGGSNYSGDELSFPAVPYTPQHFTPKRDCPSTNGEVTDFDDMTNVRNCFLLGLSDLNLKLPYVQEKISDYINTLTGAGVAGFRVDAAKHMWPEDLQILFANIQTLNTSHGFPENVQPFVYFEVINMKTDSDAIYRGYTPLGRVTEFKFSSELAKAFKSPDFFSTSLFETSGMSRSEDAVVFVDNHDTQRDHEGAVLTHKDGVLYTMAACFTLAQPFGFTRLMSSYSFVNKNTGPPQTVDDRTADVETDTKGQCLGGWECEHRWGAVMRMVQFRNAVSSSSNYTLRQHTKGVLTLDRGADGYFAMLLGDTFTGTLRTSLVAGEYQDIMSCRDVTVSVNGTIELSFEGSEYHLFAICTNCSCFEGDEPVTLGTRTEKSTDVGEIPLAISTPSTSIDVASSSDAELITSGKGSTSKTRTVIFMYKETKMGQDLFLRGGVPAEGECNPDDVSLDACAVPIEVNSLGDDPHYRKYNNFRLQDNYLDWYGAESTQGKDSGLTPSGSPLAWTSSRQSSSGYQPLNKFGDHYWMIDMDMDCSKTPEGWFHFKAFVTNAENGWENHITQAESCGGNSGSKVPAPSGNHMGRCGYINTFTFDSGSCIINQFPEPFDPKAFFILITDYADRNTAMNTVASVAIVTALVLYVKWMQ